MTTDNFSERDIKYIRENILPELLVGRKEQIEAITSERPLTVVSAGAGTGKTHTLAQRFAWLLASDPACDVRSILVLTFTEKAAREMRERIETTVRSWYSKYPSQLRHLQGAIEFMEDAPISTLHSFAMKVIRESALSLSLDPSAEIISAPSEELWWDGFASSLERLSPNDLLPLLNEKWRERAEKLFGLRDFRLYVNEYGPEALADLAKNAYGVLGTAGVTSEGLWNWNDVPLRRDIKSLSGWLRSSWGLWFETVYPAIPDELRNAGGKTLGGLMAILRIYKKCEYSDELALSVIRKIVYEGLGNLPGRSKLKTAIEAELGCGMREWRDRAKEYLLMCSEPSEEEIELHSVLSQIAALGWQCWDKLRERESVLSMDDLISYAVGVLNENPGYGEKFRHILIDEFQDTDPQQDAMVRALIKDADSTLFVVGDLKQSIYRFRHADLEIFQDYIEKAKECDDARYITLDRSYRTKGALLEKFNAVFSKIWSEGLEEGSNMVYEPIFGPEDAEWWEERNKSGTEPFELKFSAGVKLPDTIGASGGKPKREPIYDTRLRLFRNLASEFASMKEKGERIWAKTENGFGYRPVTWRDFALLVPTRTVYPVIERAFSEMSVPYTLGTSKNYFSRGEVADVVNMVYLLSNPEHPLYLGCWLASPLSGVGSEAAKSCVETAEDRSNGRDSVPLADIVRETLPEYWAAISEMRRKALLLGVSEVIAELVNRPGIIESYEPGQRRHVRANFLRMAEIADEYERAEGRSLYGFAQYLRLMDVSDRGQEEPDAIDDSEDAVKVLTIHGSKGLEYPVTAVYCDEGSAKRNSRISVSKRYGVSVDKIPEFMLDDEAEYEFKDENNSRTVRGAWHKNLEDAKEKAEKERLWYVALTRARDKLILCATGRLTDEGNINPESSGDFTASVISACGERNVTVLCGNSDTKPAAKVSGPYADTKGEALELPIVTPAKLARISASAYAMIGWCPNAYRIAYRQGRDMQWTLKSGDDGVGGADFGTLAHKILCIWDFTKEGAEYLLPDDRAAAEKMIFEIPPYLRSEYRKDSVRRALKDSLFTFAAGGESANYRSLLAEGTGKLYRETPFRVRDRDLILIGTTDLMWEDGEYVHIRDWKTTSAEFAPDEYYMEQLRFYAYAAKVHRESAALPYKPIETALNYIRRDSVPVCAETMSRSEFDRTGEKIHLAAQTALSGEFEKMTDRCLKCPWSHDCDK